MRARVCRQRVRIRSVLSKGDRITTYGLEKSGILLDCGNVKDLSVVLARIQVPVFALGQNDLLLVVPQFQRRRVLGALKVLGADLPAEYSRLRPILRLYAESNLVKDELGLLLPVHGPKCLHLQLTQNVASGFHIAVVILLQVGEDLGDAGALDFDKDLALGDCAQGLDDLNLPVNARDVAQEVNDGLDHVLNSLFELAMLLGEDRDLVAEHIPVAGVFAEGDDGNEEAGGRRKIGGLQARC